MYCIFPADQTYKNVSNNEETNKMMFTLYHVTKINSTDYMLNEIWFSLMSYVLRHQAAFTHIQNKTHKKKPIKFTDINRNVWIVWLE